MSAGADEPYGSFLLYDHKWYVGSKSGCSCTFRHLYSSELGFSEPVEWYDEDEDEVSATLLFIIVVRSLIERGHKVDCIDAWDRATMEDIQESKVNLDEINDGQFRFFENHHFRFHMS